MADGATAKSPSRDGTAKCRPFSSWRPQDGGRYDVRQIGVGEYEGLLGKSFWATQVTH